MMAYAYNPSIQEAEVGGLQFSGQPRLHRKIARFYLKTKQNEKKIFKNLSNQYKTRKQIENQPP